MEKKKLRKQKSRKSGVPISSFCFCSLPRLNLMQFILVTPTTIAISFASAPS